MKIKTFFKKNNTFRTENVIVKLAFTVGGVDYFEVDDIYNLPYKRGVQAIRFYEEVRMKCDYEYLKAHVTVVDNLFKGKQVGFDEMNRLKMLNDQLKERLYNIIDTDLIYKLASVVFFDKNESPIQYDYDYAKKKIELWKKHENINDFFLREPLQRLIPFLKVQGVNFQTYSEVVKQITSFNWESVFGELSESQKKIFSASKAPLPDSPELN